jgi:hypothetical protein
MLIWVTFNEKYIWLVFDKINYNHFIAMEEYSVIKLAMYENISER